MKVSKENIILQVRKQFMLRAKGEGKAWPTKMMKMFFILLMLTSHITGMHLQKLLEML